MKIPFYKMHGAGNDFIMINTHGIKDLSLSQKEIRSLCQRRTGIGADGLITLSESDQADFKMTYYNADGKEGSMCGNGGRCAVYLAHVLKLYSGKETRFMAIDGLHLAKIMDAEIVSLQMQDVKGIQRAGSGSLLNTGSPHYVIFVDKLNSFNVTEEGRRIRNDRSLFPEGVNVNFIEILSDDTVFVRTYERGVEDETLSCGTGITAAALVAVETKRVKDNGEIKLSAPGGNFSVKYKYHQDVFHDIYLEGPVKLVFSGEIEH